MKLICYITNNLHFKLGISITYGSGLTHNNKNAILLRIYFGPKYIALGVKLA